MKKIKIPEDLAHKFWREYEEADFLDRDKLLEPIVKNFTPMTKIKDEKMRKHILKMYLGSYFDDLIEYFYDIDNSVDWSKKIYKL
ncbi:hypothetical protein HZC30_06485 [Candidatus Woesearchaeota archaeon]|nr:hypothetical protein [Candidatus Woesearchaeota archaeon]